MDYDIQKVAYDARFKSTTDLANIIETAVSDSRVSTIRTMIEAGLSTEIILKAGFTIDEIHNNLEAKALYDARFKQITDEANRIHSAKLEERQSILEQLLKQNVSDEVILACGFSTQEINEIRKNTIITKDKYRVKEE